MVNRKSFDAFLVEKAVQEGCILHDGEKVSSITQEADSVSVHTGSISYKARVMLGADGANGITAKALHLMQDAFIGISIESEIAVSASILEDWRHTVLLDLGSIPYGYGWVFPKKEHLSIGVAGPQSRSAEVNAYFQRFSSHWHQQMGFYNIQLKRGHRLPVLRKNAVLHRQRAILIGDAAGLTDPLSGEGIYYAIRSAQMAAHVIKNFLTDEQLYPLSNYQKLIEQDLIPNLQRAKAYLTLFNLYPRLFYSKLEKSKRLWIATCNLLQGKTSYREIGQSLGKLSFILDLLAW